MRKLLVIMAFVCCGCTPEEIQPKRKTFTNARGLEEEYKLIEIEGRKFISYTASQGFSYLAGPVDDPNKLTITPGSEGNPTRITIPYGQKFNLELIHEKESNQESRQEKTDCQAENTAPDS